MVDIQTSYLEIMDFFESSGGSYSEIDTFTYQDILDALFDDRIIYVKDGDKTVSITSIWKIHKEDLELVANGGKPNDVSTGNIVYVADHAGVGGYKGLSKLLRSLCTTCCWHHRYKTPEAFRMYSKGDIV